MRQHVNPLSHFFQAQRDLPGINDLFCNSKLPLHLDIGSARGEYLLELAPLQKEWNHLGLEIRFPLVDSANRNRKNLEIKNLNFLFCNANVGLDKWLDTLPFGLLQRVSIQFPDPWFKRRHRKRRVLQPSLLLALSNSLSVGKELLIKTDIRDLVESMSELIDLTSCYTLVEGKSSKSFSSTLTSVRTEREAYVVNQGLPIYHRLYQRNTSEVPSMYSLEEALDKSHLKFQKAERI